MTTSGPQQDLPGGLTVQAAMARLRGQFGAGDNRAAGGLGGPEDAIGNDPRDDLRTLAAIWGLLPPSQASARPERERSSVQGLGPASLAMEAERLGLQARLRACAVADLSAGDFPCLVLTASGASRLVLGLTADGKGFRVHDGRGDRPVAASALAADQSGTVVVLSALAEGGEERAHAAGTTGKPAPQGQGGRLIARKLGEAMRGQRRLLIQLAVASAVINLFGLLLPLFSMAVFDRVIPHGAMETLWALTLGVAVALVLELALRQARLTLFDAAAQSMSHGLQGLVMTRLLGLSPRDLPRSSGAAVQPMQDLEGLAHLAPQLVVSLCVDLPFFIVMVVLIASLAGPIALAPIIGVLILAGLHVAGHRLAARWHIEHGGFQRQQQQFSIDAVTAQERIRITSAGAGLLARWDVAADAAGYAAHRSRHWHGLAAQAGAIVVQGVMLVTLVAGVYRIDAALMTIGGLSASILLVNRAMLPVSTAIGLVFRALQVLESTVPLAPLLAAPLESGGDGRHNAGDIAGGFDLHQVTFSYPDEDRPVLRNLSLSIAPGERIGIIGKAGSGKSTLLKLLVRLNEVGGGRIHLDGRDLRQYDPQALRQAVSYMPQDAQLIDGTIEDNLVLGLDHVSPDELERAARLSGVREFARTRPQGYRLNVGPGGRHLSGGERQAVALGRALIGAPRLLVLDEPTAALDNNAEARLIADLKRELGGTGLVIATHRLTMLALVDRVIWLEGGQIAADGPKADVFARLGLAA